MKRLLVVTTVHPSDDPRIREKHIRTLATDFNVLYATKLPAPSDRDGIEWHPLRGGRAVRWFRALRVMLAARVDVIVVHDPELIPVAVAVRTLRGVPVVFDLHENVPALAFTRTSIPRPLRRPLAGTARFWLSVAERSFPITLAEDGYRSLFRWNHPVFPNYLDAGSLPEPTAEERGGVVYVGDVTEQRGAVTLLDAAVRAGVDSVTYVGRCNDELRERIVERAAGTGIDVRVLGWRTHTEAMAIAGRAAVGVSPLHDTPNYRNSLPTKTLEYLAMGTPVVASDLPGTRNVIGTLPGVRLVPPGDVEALASALEAVDAELAAAAAAGTDDVRKRFRWPAEAVREFYASLTAG